MTYRLADHDRRRARRYRDPKEWTCGSGAIPDPPAEVPRNQDLWDETKQKATEEKCKAIVAGSCQDGRKASRSRRSTASSTTRFAQQSGTGAAERRRTSSLGQDPTQVGLSEQPHTPEQFDPSPSTTERTTELVEPSYLVRMCDEAKGLTLVDAINEALEREMHRDQRRRSPGEDVGPTAASSVSPKASEDLQEGDRVIDTPLAESGIMGTAIGLAMGGMRPHPRNPVRGLPRPGLRPVDHHAVSLSLTHPRRVTIPMTVRRPVGGGIPPGTPLGFARSHLRPTPGSRWSCPARRSMRRACSFPPFAIPIRSSSSSASTAPSREEVPEEEYRFRSARRRW